jgi:hypothetical protein
MPNIKPIYQGILTYALCRLVRKLLHIRLLIVQHGVFDVKSFPWKMVDDTKYSSSDGSAAHQNKIICLS